LKQFKLILFLEQHTFIFLSKKRLARLQMSIELVQVDEQAKVQGGVVLSDLSQCVEELICNSLDAGASRISVSVDAASWTLSVQDNGSGIARQDLEAHIATVANSTSKLHSLDELEHGVLSYGFRGDALRLLACCSTLEIVTRRANDAVASWKMVRGGQLVGSGLCSRWKPPGTTVSVSDLFFSLPVKRKVAGVASRQLEAIRIRVARLALANAQCAFSLTDSSRGVVALSCVPSASPLRTLWRLYPSLPAGDDASYARVELKHASARVRLSGYISGARRSHSTGAMQFLFVNRRFVEPPSPPHRLANQLYAALVEDDQRVSSSSSSSSSPPPPQACSLSRKHRYPIYVLNVECSPSLYDVGYVPAKSVIHFDDEWSAVMSLIVHVFMQMQDSDDSEHEEEENNEQVEEDEHEVVDTTTTTTTTTTVQKRVLADRLTVHRSPSKRQRRVDDGDDVSALLANWQNLCYGVVPDDKTKVLDSLASLMKSSMAVSFTKAMVDRLELLGQVDAKYLVCRCDDMVVALDQHAVDERIRLERMQHQVFGARALHEHVRPRFLSDALRLSVSPRQRAVLVEHRAAFELWGWSYTFDALCDTAALVHSVPCALNTPLERADHFVEFIDALQSTGGSTLTRPPALARMLNSKACRGAIMFGDVLSRTQCTELLVGLRSCNAPFQCAHGRPSVVPLVHIDTLGQLLAQRQASSSSSPISFDRLDALFPSL
jgi:DNA mismatch repair protein MutL